MIRNVKDVSSLLDRRFGNAAGLPLSIARTLAWVLVGVYLFGLLVPPPKLDFNSTPYNSRLPSGTRDLILDKNDPRGWEHLKHDPSKFTIAWIATSTVENVKPGRPSFIPADLRARLPMINGKPVRVNMYLLEAGRMLDIYNATQEAIASKPDLIMIDLNPVFLFNDTAIQGWSTLNGAVFTTLARDPTSWEYIAALGSPQDAALALGSSHLRALKGRWSYAEKLREKLDALSPLNPPALNPAAALPTPQKNLNYASTLTTPLAFWTYFRPLIPDGLSVREKQVKLLQLSVTDGSIINDDIVNDLFTTVARSHIPSIAYMPPLEGGALRNPAFDRTLRGIETHLREIADRRKSANLLVKWQSATRVVTGLKFRDLGHMTYSTPMTSYLVGLVCAQLRANAPSTQCNPIPKATASR